MGGLSLLGSFATEVTMVALCIRYLRHLSFLLPLGFSIYLSRVSETCAFIGDYELQVMEVAVEAVVEEV